MESCVEHGNLGDIGKDIKDRPDAHEVGRVVKRGKGNAIFDDVKNFLVYDDGFCKLFPPVNDTMPNSRKLVQARQRPVVCVKKVFSDEADRDLVVGNVCR